MAQSVTLCAGLQKKEYIWKTQQLCLFTEITTPTTIGTTGTTTFFLPKYTHQLYRRTEGSICPLMAGRLCDGAGCKSQWRPPRLSCNFGQLLHSSASGMDPLPEFRGCSSDFTVLNVGATWMMFYISSLRALTAGIRWYATPTVAL